MGFTNSPATIRGNGTRQAFTLVELAIVLVIIGLIVGGVLVGQDLIKAAEIRAVASDIQKFNTGVGAFETKYNGIPGDLLSTSAQNFGLTVSVVNPGTVGEGDGDGRLQNGTSSSTGGLGGENTLFWRQLGDAHMIPFTSNADGTTIDTSGFDGGSVSIAALTPLLPPLRLRKTGFIQIGDNVFGGNGYRIASWIAGDSDGRMITGSVLSPREAQGIDAKLDDGYPDRGTVESLAAGFAAPSGGGTPVTASDTYCYDSGASPPVYAMASEDIANGVRCALAIKAGF